MIAPTQTTALYAVRFADGEVRYGGSDGAGVRLAPLFATRTEAQVFAADYLFKPRVLRSGDPEGAYPVAISDGYGQATALATRTHLITGHDLELTGPAPVWARKLTQSVS